MVQKNLSKRLFVGITGKKSEQLYDKIKEVEELGITKVSLFLEFLEKRERLKVYQYLLNSNIKSIPLVHIKNGMSVDELNFLVKKFEAKYLTIHESSFNFIKEWKGYYKKLFLEMNTDDFVPENVCVEKIGGFCIDLSHFKVEETKRSKEFDYITKRRKNQKMFKCNHINGYSYKKNTDLHTITNLKEFNYLKTLPDFLFGRVIAIETFNSIREQLKFKEYIIKLLS